ncbi:MAG: hypothetical protein HQ539_03160 [Parcubacteria group bacterium]|nr:hypothetical protein [Parcubacteria group bacterium]
MCGIFGIATNKNSGFSSELLKDSADKLFRFSESRGKEASGVALFRQGKIQIYKRPEPASRLIKSKEYGDLFRSPASTLSDISALIGHARLVTNGALEDNRNNQPVVKQGIAAVHNGIIVNDNEIWEAFSQLKREYEVDTEVMLALLEMFLSKGSSVSDSFQDVFSIIKGAASVALLFEKKSKMVLATNTGSLYVCWSRNKDVLFFASELYILKKFLKWRKLKFLGPCKISQVKPMSGLVIDLEDLGAKQFFMKKTKFSEVAERTVQPKSSEVIRALVPKSLIIDNQSQVAGLKRCSRCILPETMPFIDFDNQGVCNYCREYKKVKLKGKEALEKVLAGYRANTEKLNVIVPLSGGRDSCFTLHYAKNILGLSPIAYTYDWGMVTDLARRNQARICGQLGVEHILVSADIRKKRENIRKNVSAWLKKPNLGTVPLFMAGDKQYFYYANQLSKQTNIKLILFGSNPYEKTDFKYGFCKVKQGTVSEKQTKHAVISNINKFKIAFYYTSQFFRNPAYLNSSLLDTFTGYLSYYFIPHNYLLFYRYRRWDEKEVVSTLLEQYNWELSEDTKDTWRIGDGTAPFYNYIYYTIAGFTENDTFRSNQIREGVITRDEALKAVKESNQPRYPSIKWYCDTIGIDFEETLKIINSVPRLY